MADATPTTTTLESVRALRAQQREWLRKQARAQRELAAAQRRRRARAQTGPALPRTELS